MRRTFLAGLALTACLEGEPGPRGQVTGRVALTTPSGDELELGPTEVLFIPEETMAPFVEGKLAGARAEFQRAQAARDEAQARVNRLAEERRAADHDARTSGAGVRDRALDLQRRQLTPRELGTQRTRLAEQHAASKRRLSELGQRLEEARAELERAREATLRVTDGSFLLVGLPAPAQSTTAGSDGRFEVRVAPGSYAVVATTHAADGAARTWLVWTRVQATGADALWLNNDNLAGTGCGACIITPSFLAGGPPGEPGTR